MGQKAEFLLILKVFTFIPSYTLWVTPQDFTNWKTLLRYISVVSFISIAFMVVKLKIFKVFRIDLAFMKWPLFFGGGGREGVRGGGRGFGPLLCQILFNLAEILTRHSVPIRKTQYLKNPPKFWILAQMVFQRLQFCSILGPNLLPENQKYCLKPKLLQKLHP